VVSSSGPASQTTSPQRQLPRTIRPPWRDRRARGETAVVCDERSLARLGSGGEKRCVLLGRVVTTTDESGTEGESRTPDARGAGRLPPAGRFSLYRITFSVREDRHETRAATRRERRCGDAPDARCGGDGPGPNLGRDPKVRELRSPYFDSSRGRRGGAG